MNDLDAKESRLLAGVRREWSPKESDPARVLASLNAALLVPSPPTAPSAAVLASRYFLGVLALGVAGLTGYGWGYRAGSAARVPPAVAVAGGGAASPSPSPSPPPEEAATAVPAVPLPVASGKPLPRAASARGAVLSAARKEEAEAPSAGLDEEVRQLRRIERALRAGNPRLALVIAEDLDRTIPNGQLLLERRAASLMAGCQLEAEGAVERARLFLAQNANSAYAPRVREMCERAQRNPPASGTDGGNPGGNR